MGEADGEARSRSARTVAPRQDRLAQPVAWTGGVEGQRGPPGAAGNRGARRKRLEGRQDVPGSDDSARGSPEAVGPRPAARQRGARPAPGERARGRGLSRRHVTEHTAAGPAACPLPWPTGGAAGRREILGTFAWEQEADGLWGQHEASPYCVPARPGEGPCRVTDSRVDRRGDTSRAEEASSTRPSP